MNVPIIHSRPIRLMIPIGAIAGTGTDGMPVTTKPGDLLSIPSGVKRLPKYPVVYQSEIVNGNKRVRVIISAMRVIIRTCSMSCGVLKRV